jgi:hypothetical protein
MPSATKIRTAVIVAAAACSLSAIALPGVAQARPLSDCRTPDGTAVANHSELVVYSPGGQHKTVYACNDAVLCTSNYTFRPDPKLGKWHLDSSSCVRADDQIAPVDAQLSSP